MKTDLLCITLGKLEDDTLKSCFQYYFCVNFSQITKELTVLFCLSFKGCTETFQSFESIKAHLISCEKVVSYKCLACGKVYLSIMLLHNHINFRHVGYKVIIQSIVSYAIKISFSSPFFCFFFLFLLFLLIDIYNVIHKELC